MRSPSGWLVAVLLVASGVFWAVMFFGPLAHLQRLAGGAAPFDIRPLGYSHDEARAFLAAIGAAGRAYYASPELVLDSVYPALYALSRGLALWWLTMPGRWREAAMPQPWRGVLIAVPLTMATLDYAENAGIAAMLWLWPDLPPLLVAATSLASRVKIMAGALTEMLMAICAALAVLHWLGRRRPA